MSGDPCIEIFATAPTVGLATVVSKFPIFPFRGFESRWIFTDAPRSVRGELPSSLRMPFSTHLDRNDVIAVAVGYAPHPPLLAVGLVAEDWSDCEFEIIEAAVTTMEVASGRLPMRHPETEVPWLTSW